MSTPLDSLVDQLADAVARRVIELQKLEAERTRTQFLTPTQMAERLGVKTKTLANQRSAGTGPKFVKVGGAVRYPVNAD
jgi:predicted DNA-binding transcriptional regulator AlpA